MTRTIAQQYRDAGDLMLMLDFRGGNYLDQSGNGHTLTLPSNARLSRQGLRCKSTPATVSIDLSGVQNMGVFALVAGMQLDTTDEQVICLHTTSFSAAGAFSIYQSSGNHLTSTWQGSSGACQSLITTGDISRTDGYFVSSQFDRRLSYESVKPYFRGVYAADPIFISDNNTNDGSGFANSTLHLMAAPSFYTHQGLLQAFGILDFTDRQLTATEQATLYSEVRDRRTM
jgi:hypothetical protein